MARQQLSTFFPKTSLDIAFTHQSAEKPFKIKGTGAGPKVQNGFGHSSKRSHCGEEGVDGVDGEDCSFCRFRLTNKKPRGMSFKKLK